jgi:hypothetical protein
MALKTKTITNAVHRTTVTYEPPADAVKDGGRRWISETFNLINAHHQVGVLTVAFGLGGSITSIIFEEKETIPQRNLEVETE